MNDQNKKPALDEQTFGKLLEAAYVIQEHNSEMRQMEESLEQHSEQLREQEAVAQNALKSKLRPQEESVPDGDYTLTLAEIVEAQHQIQIRHLQSDMAMAVVAERTARITNASGAAVAILDGKMVRYRAGAGAPALPVGTEVPLAAAICATCIRTGQVLRTPDINSEFLFDPELCRQRSIESLTAVPIYNDGNIVGALELYFDHPQGFVDQDIHTCQLMAGLVTEAIGRDAGSALKKSVAAERSTIMDAIEKLKPELTSLAGQQAGAIGSKNADTKKPAMTSKASAQNNICWKCGTKLVGEELFCGNCGAPRTGESDLSSLQSKVASAWNKQGADASAVQSSIETTLPPDVLATLFSTEAKQDAKSNESKTAQLVPSASLPALGNGKPSIEILDKEQDNDKENSTTALAKAESEDPTWTSAANARDFLETAAEPEPPTALARFWRARRGDFYLALAVVLVIAVIRWGILANDSVGATGRSTTITSGGNKRKPSPDADLSMFDKLLISLGLAEAPEAPEYKGNPDTQVWVDLHTALYYCPGSNFYGKTVGGKYSSQREAQLDQFEPALRKACD